MQRSSYWLQRTVRGGLELNAKQPIEVKLSSSEPIFQFFASGRVEFSEHFSFLHVEDNAPRRNGLSAQQAFGKFLGALARQTGQCVLRNVAGHLVSGPIKRIGRNCKE
jgi:hypothetical protein